MKLHLFALMIGLSALSCHGIDLGSIGDIIESGRKITTGTIAKIPDFIPSPKFMYQSGKDIVAGYPFKIAFQAINHLCSAALYSDSIQPRISPDVNAMSFLLVTPEANYTFPILEPNKMWTSPTFDPKKKVVILTTGWTTDLTQSRGDVNTIAQAYFCRNDSNFVVVDSARFIDMLYTWSAFNTEMVGESIGKGLAELIKIVPTERIHLIGHSLGAHISGAAGRTFTLITGKLLPRITGLDPANPCFNEGETLTGLQRGDAKFIDVIHSNSGALGKRDPIGDVDFYPGGTNALPPGCLDIACAHSRSWRYYAESATPGREKNFMATKCNSLYKLNVGKCPGDAIPMGYLTPNTAKGNYFLDVNGDEPFGKNATESEVKCL